MCFIELPQTNRLRALHAEMRDAGAPREVFVANANRIIRDVLETCIGQMPYVEHTVKTPVGATYVGTRVAVDVCAVSVVRAGESMEFELSNIFPTLPIGKILIQRDKVSKQAKLFFTSLPEDIAQRHVILMEPMLATGGSALMAISELIAQGVDEERIFFANILASPEGLERVRACHPEMTIVSSSVEQELNQEAFMIPGVGDFGDRYFGTIKSGGQNGQQTRLPA
ncbi:uracil phosphoribosyltransferase [Epibacterium ulvae]|uniref:uracil phosphoribosyltransferase n=1 Tax=Epibacterium ulvae TaxID=1156985 RepID=UPI0024913C92|nr:uracil phosphoribosyltransferase [Epibacterium ulvae]